ncbi:MAG: ABC transporter permease [Bacteroides sp.]|jgi:ABC-2 type transport system permease protein|nr:ABC transporter permease [Bacteroides sp.]
MIKFLIEKEFKQLLRNPFLPRMILVFPCMIMILMPWAADLEIKNINLNIVDNDHSVISRRLVDKIEASTYFKMKGLPKSYNEGLKAIEEGDADIVLEIPRNFEKNWMKGNSPRVLIAANAVNGTKGGLGSSYLASIISRFSEELQADRADVKNGTAGTTIKISTESTANSEVSSASVGTGSQQSAANQASIQKIEASPTAAEIAVPQVKVMTQNLFNPNLDYKRFMIPALMVQLLTLLCGFLPALNVVSEKEAGTIEQINVTPVGKLSFILAKLIPYWTVGFIVLTLCFGLAAFLYGILPAGHFLIIYFYCVIFVLAISGFGLVISNNSSTMQQAMFVMWFFMLVLILMSGLFTPIHSMPQWAQGIAMFNPMKYLMEAMRAIYLRGSGISDLWIQLAALSGFALLFNVWAVRSYKKTN